MKKLFSLIVLITIIGKGLAQSNPSDTIYYKNGSIKKIHFEKDLIITGEAVDVYYEQSDDINKLGRRIIDTSYYWRNMKSATRYYLDNNLRIEKGFSPTKSINYNQYGKIDNNQIFGIYNVWVMDYGIKKIVFYLGNDSVIKKIDISELDTSKGYSAKQSFVHTRYKNGLGEDINGHFFTLSHKDEYVGMTFYDDGYSMKTFYYSNIKNNEPIGKKVFFYPNLIVQEYGNKLNGERTGEWKEYYINGKLKAKGEYYPQSIVDEINMRFIPWKDKKWCYYDENGKLEKQETWDKGKLKKTKLFN